LALASFPAPKLPAVNRFLNLGLAAMMSSILLGCNRSDKPEELPPWSKVNTETVWPPPTNKTVTPKAEIFTAANSNFQTGALNVSAAPWEDPAVIQRLEVDYGRIRKWFVGVIQMQEKLPLDGPDEMTEILRLIANGQRPPPEMFQAARSRSEAMLAQTKVSGSFLEAYKPVARGATLADEALDRFKTDRSKASWDALGSALRTLESALATNNWPPAFHSSDARDGLEVFHEVVSNIIEVNRF